MNTTITILKICASIGLLDTLYLIWHKVQGTDVACIGFPKEWCRKVQYSPYSKTFGAPNSVLGFFMYLLIALLVTGTLAWPWWTIQAIVAFGFAFSLYFTYIQAFVLRAYCTWCVVSALNFLVMFWAVFIR